MPSVIFRDEDGRHGNFHTASYQSIQASADWIIRLNKVYTSSRWIPRRWDRSRAELDCANSSDALLMNIFCHPGLLERPAVSSLLGVDSGLCPEFGFKPRIPLKSGRTDQTEIDMRLGGLLIEAKLTEGNFQTCSLARIQKYQSAEEVFDVEELPRRGDRVESYQLIRGALAAWHLGQSFAVLSDARRADLVERWFKVIRAVRSCDLRSRLALVTWQELASTVPNDLQTFLEIKYGIVPVSLQRG